MKKPGVNIILLVTYFTGIVEIVGVRVKASIYIENLSQWSLVNGCYWTNRGKVTSSHLELRSGKTEIWESQKSWGWSGTSGIIVYDLDDSSNTSIAIVWEAPFNFASDKNNLALGILNTSTSAVEEDKELMNLYDQLDNNRGEDFPRCYKNYDNLVEPCLVSCLLTCQSQVRLIGTMGTTHKPKIHVTVLPLDEDDYWKGSLRDTSTWTPIEHLTPGATLLGTSEKTITAVLGISYLNSF